MEMTDLEIMGKYNRAGTPYEKRKQVRVLAELNGVSVQTMREHIQALKDGPKAEVKKRGRKPKEAEPVVHGKKRGQKPKTSKAAGVVVEAVKLRLEEVGNLVEQHKRELETYLEEWGQLTEWIKANE